MLFAKDTFFPLSLCAIAGEVTRDDVAAMGAHYDAMHARGRRFVAFVDARRSAVPSSEIRRALADMSNRFTELSKKNSICTVTILDSKILVGAMTAVRWFLKDEMELRYLASATEGMRYASDKLRAENIAVPDGALEFAKKLDVAKIDQLAALFTGDRST